MKKITVLLLAVLFGASFSFAQIDEETTDEEEDNTISNTTLSYKGSFGNLNGGIAYHNLHNVKSELRAAFDTDEKFENVNMGINLGASGMTIIDGNFLIGGTVGYTMITEQTINMVTVKMDAANIGLRFGALAYYKNDLMIYPFFGTGMSQYFMQMTSDSSSIEYDFNTPLEIGVAQKYTSTYNYVELGVSVLKHINDKFIIGAEAGAYYSPKVKNTWKNEGEEVLYRNAPGYNGAFFKITLGFGKIAEKAIAGLEEEDDDDDDF